MGITVTYWIILLVAFALMAAIAIVDSAWVAKKHSDKTLRLFNQILTVFLLIAIIYLCYENFPVSLTLLTLGTGLIFLIDRLFLAKRRHRHDQPGTLVRNSKEFFPVLLLVWVIRSFIIQPYQVPTGSLEPTVIPGDFIVVKQYPYGIKFPIGNYTLIKTGQPKTGDIVLFYYPIDPRMVYVKRVIGTPGDHIVYKNKILYINGKKAPQQPVSMDQDVEPGQDPISVQRWRENLNGVVHDIFIQPEGGETQDIDVVVPDKMYFMMGDNRDDSDDSRMWGFVPERNIIGQAFGVWMSWDANNHSIRFNRIGKSIH